MRSLLISVLLFILNSCSLTGKPVAFREGVNKNKKPPVFVIENEAGDSKKITPSITESSYLSDYSFGPSEEFIKKSLEDAPDEQKVRSPIVGVFFGPGLQRTMVFLDLFKEFKRRGISIHVLSGTGFGNVIAGLMASNLSLGRVEWVLFKFWSKAKKYKPYSEKWYDILEKVVLKEFGRADIQNLGNSVFLPSALEKGRIHFFKTGSPRDIFKKAFFQVGEKKSEKRFIHFDRKVFLKRGVDIIINVGALGSKVTLSNSNKFLKHSFEQFVMEKEGSLMFNHYDLFFEFLEGGEAAIDSLQARKKWEKKGKSWAKLTSDRVKAFIKVWKKESENSKKLNNKRQ